MDLNISTMPFIIIVVYLLTWFLKKKVFVTDESRKNLPPVAAAMGGAIALALYFLAPETMSCSSVVGALETGFGSGLAAVGCNQVYKQYRKFKDASIDDGYGDDNTGPVTITVSPVIDNNNTTSTASTTEIDQSAMTPAADETTSSANMDCSTNEYIPAEEEAMESAIEAESTNDAADDDRVGG